MIEYTGPLAGVRVLDASAVLMAPFASQMLADLGADVIKVETPTGDSTRKIGPGAEKGLGPIFLNTNRNKRSVVLDLKAPEGLEAFMQLAKTADVVLSNIRPKGMARLGLTYEALVEVNPRIIMVNMVGFSQRGRNAASPAFDDLIQAAIGLPLAIAQNSDGEPRYLPLNVCDRSVGLYGFGVISAALYSREKTGKGQRIDVPMFETMLPYMLGDHLYGEKFIPAQGSYGYPRLLARNRQPYKTLDSYVSCTIYTDAHWHAFLGILGCEERMRTDPRLHDINSRTAHIDELYAFVREEIAKRTTDEWRELLRHADIPVIPVNTLEQLLDDPHLKDIEFFREVEHPVVGTIREMAVPSEWHGTPPDNYRPPAQLGEHSVEVLMEAGYSADQVAALAASGITSYPDTAPGAPVRMARSTVTE